MMSLDQMKEGVKYLPIEVLVIQGESRRFAKWNIWDCSMCGYPCGYLVNIERRENEIEVAYDSGCDCTHGQNITPRSYEEMYGHYTMQSNEEVRRRMEEVFHVSKEV